MAIAFAIIVLIATFGLALLQLFAAGMSDVPNAKSGAGVTMVIGLVIAALIFGSHWLPHIPW